MWSAFIRYLYGRAGEAYEGGVWQGISQVFCETIGDVGAFFLFDSMSLKAILAAVGLVGDEDDVAAVREEGILLLVITLGRELLDGGKDHASRGHLEERLVDFPVLGLDRGLAEQVLAGGEGVE